MPAIALATLDRTLQSVETGHCAQSDNLDNSRLCNRQGDPMPIEHLPDGWFVAGCPCCGEMGLLLQAPEKGSLPRRRPTVWDQGEPERPSILVSVGCAKCKATVTMNVYER